MRERIKKRLADASAKARVFVAILLGAVVPEVVSRLLKLCVPEGQEGPFFIRVLQWLRDMLTWIRTDWLLIAAGTAFLLYAWDERAAWYAAIKRIPTWKWHWRATSRKERIAKARRWIRLSEEMLTALSYSAQPTFLRPPSNPTQEQVSEFSRQQADMMLARFQNEMNRMRHLFLVRIAQAKSEMLEEGVALPKGLERSSVMSRSDVVLVNNFDVQQWSAIFGAAGRQVLADLGEEL